MRRPMIAMAILLTTMLPDAVAQAQGPYGPGQIAALRGVKVRLHTYRGTIQGIVQGIEGDDVLLRRSSWQTDEMPVTGILRVDLYSRDRESTIAGMTLGGVVGLGIGVGVGSWLDSVDDEENSRRTGTVLVGTLGALVGATVGGHLMGAVWTPLPARTPQVGFDPHRGALTLTCAF